MDLYGLQQTVKQTVTTGNNYHDGRVFQLIKDLSCFIIEYFSVGNAGKIYQVLLNI